MTAFDQFVQPDAKLLITQFQVEFTPLLVGVFVFWKRDKVYFFQCFFMREPKLGMNMVGHENQRREFKVLEFLRELHIG